MIRQCQHLVVDLILATSATALAFVLRDNFDFSLAKVADLSPYMTFTLVAATVAFSAFQTPRSVWRLTTMADCLQLSAATAATVVGAVALGFGCNRLDGVPRSLPVLQGMLMLLSLVGVRALARMWHGVRENTSLGALTETFGSESILIVGTGELTGLYLRSVARFAQGRVRIAGILANEDRHVGCSIQRHQVLGTPEQIAQALQRLEVHGVFVDRIVVTIPFESLSHEAQAALLGVEGSGSIRLEFLIDQMGLGPRAAYGVDDRTLMQRQTFPCPFAFGVNDAAALARRRYWRVKRTFDFVTALSLLIALAPLMLLAAALVAIDLGLPVMFWQQRPGLNGRPFKLYKLRTMAAAHDAAGRRVRDEDRSSCIGRFLRRTRLDELPQLINILAGEMSFVGPRPLLPVDQPTEFVARLLVRPGLTGWAQIKGGRDISARDKGALDVWYVHNASLALDIEVLARTILMVIFGEKIDAAAIQRAWQDLSPAESAAPDELTNVRAYSASPLNIPEAEHAG